MKSVQIQYETFERILEISRRLGSTRDLNEILSLIIDAMRDLLGAERATVFEFDAKAQHLVSSVAHGLIAADGEVRIGLDRGIAGASASERAVINVPDAYADERFNREVDRMTGFRTRNILAVPMIDIDDQLIGVAQVLNKRDGAFDAADEAIAEALAAQAAVAIKQARLLEDQIARQRMERDLEVARKIQQATFPRGVPQVPGFAIAAWNEPADSTGGDAYDLIPLGEPQAEGEHDRAMLLLADATGHGIGPALHATGIRAMLRMACRLDIDLSRIVRQINSQLCEDMPSGHFITAWHGLISARRSELISFSAGHGPLFHYHAADGAIDELDADTLPYGITDDLEPVEPRRFQLLPGDLFIVMTDGFNEAMNSDDEQFGHERTCNFIREHDALPPDQFIRRLVHAVDEFRDDRPAGDDRTIIVIQRNR